MCTLKTRQKLKMSQMYRTGPEHLVYLMMRSMMIMRKHQHHRLRHQETRIPRTPTRRHHLVYKHNRQCMFNAGMIPNITENPRNRKRTKRGRKRLFNAALHALRPRVDRTFAWEDKFKRLLLRFEHIQQRHFGMKLLAYTLINVREFCGA